MVQPGPCHRGPSHAPPPLAVCSRPLSPLLGPSQLIDTPEACFLLCSTYGQSYPKTRGPPQMPPPPVSHPGPPQAVLCLPTPSTTVLVLCPDQYPGLCLPLQAMTPGSREGISFSPLPPHKVPSLALVHSRHLLNVKSPPYLRCNHLLGKGK